MESNSTKTPFLEWQGKALNLLKAIQPLFKDGQSEVALKGMASDHDAQADRLEAFARPCLLLSFWLRSLRFESSEDDRKLSDQWTRWFREALALGTDPDSKHYWGPNANFHQNGVEMGLLCIALELAKDEIWNPLDAKVKQQVIDWIASNRGSAHHWNNHFFFGIFCLEFLESVGAGRKADRLSIRNWFEEMEWMYRGQGWFMDGMNQSYDHYNAYAFHFYAPFWIYLYGDRQPETAKKWKPWTQAFLNSYQHSFAESGEHPAFGRSITYRFNASAPFSIGHLIGASDLSPGKLRRLCRKNLDFFLEKPIYQEQGAIGIGWHDVFPEIAEPYSCAGSVYWCAKAFTPLLINPEDPFWTEAESQLESEKNAFVHVVKPAGLTFRLIEGDVEILNAGSDICAGNRDKFGPWKWGKVAYRTSFGFTIGSKTHYPYDLGLTAEDLRDNRVFGRHYTVPLEMSENHYLSSYNLGDRDLQFNVIVETLIAWKGPWLMQIHLAVPTHSANLAMGGYSLPVSGKETLRESKSDLQFMAESQGKRISLQSIGGDGDFEIQKRLDDSSPRKHIMSPYHVTPVYKKKIDRLKTHLFASIIGATRKDADLWTPWKIESLDDGKWTLHHDQAGKWEIESDWLPKYP